MFAVYRHSDLSDNIFFCLLTAIAKVQFVNRKASFLIIGDVNAHHEEWIKCSTMNLHSRASDFVSSSGCELMVKEPTNIDGGLLDLVLTSHSNFFAALCNIFAIFRSFCDIIADM